jgi:hypothetical protein
MTTNVLFAGTTSGRKVVSIFNNPEGQAGSNLPLTTPTNYLDRIYFDTRFDYLNILWKTDYIQYFPLISADLENPSRIINGTNVYTIGMHNFGYVPAAMLIDYDTREIISSNMYIQTVGSKSARIASFLMDDTRFYIRERYKVQNDDLPALTRRYSLIAFSNSANVLSF